MYQPPPNDSPLSSPGLAAAPSSSASSLPNGVSSSNGNGSTGLHHETQNGYVIPTSATPEQSLEALVLALSKQPMEPPVTADTSVAMIEREKPPKNTPAFEQFFGNNYSVLPFELLLVIFYYFTMGELLKLRRVSRSWKVIAESPYLWRVHLQVNHTALTRGRLWQFLFDTPLPEIHYRYSREVFRIELPTEPRVTLRALYESAQRYNLVPRPFNQPGKGYNLDYSTLFSHPEQQNFAKLDETVQCLYRDSQHFEAQVRSLSERTQALAQWQAPITTSDFHKTIPNKHYFNLALYLLSSRHIENIFCVLEILKQIHDLMRQRPPQPNKTIDFQYGSTRSDILAILINSQFNRNLTARGLLVVDATMLYAIEFLITTWIQIQPYTPESYPRAAQYRVLMARIDELLNRLSTEDLSTYIDYGYEQSHLLVQGLKAHHPGLIAKVNQSILLRVAKNIAQITGENVDCIVNDPLLINKLDDNHFIMIAKCVSYDAITNLFNRETPFRNRLDSFLTPHGISSFVMKLFESSEKRIYMADEYAQVILSTKAYLDALSDEQIIYILTTIKTGASTYDKLLTNAQFIERLNSNIIFTLTTTSHGYLSRLLKYPDLIAKKLTAEHAFLIARGDVAIESARLFYDQFHSHWSRQQLHTLYTRLKRYRSFETSDFGKAVACEFGERIQQERMLIQQQEQARRELETKEQAEREQEQARLQKQRENERLTQDGNNNTQLPASWPARAPFHSPYTIPALQKHTAYVTATSKVIEPLVESSDFSEDKFDWTSLFIVIGVTVGMGLILTGVLALAGAPIATSALAYLALETGLSLNTTMLLSTALGFISYVASSVVGVSYNSEKLSSAYQEKQDLTSHKTLRVIPQTESHHRMGNFSLIQAQSSDLIDQVRNYREGKTNTNTASPALK